MEHRDDFKVLVVDDSEDCRKLMKILLGRYHVIVDAVDNALDGISKALTSDYSAILMDLNLPGMNGFEAVSNLRMQGYCRPVFAFTAHSDYEIDQKALNSGFTEVLQKPLDCEMLIRRIRAWDFSERHQARASAM